jgi:hypothetical protein
MSREHGVWRSPVARLLWEQEVPGSNPGAPILADWPPVFRPYLGLRVHVDEHPLYRMWKARLDLDVEREQARAARRAEREAERVAWYAAWDSYKGRSSGAGRPQKPQWWNLPGWFMWLMRLHAAGRPN